MDTLRSDLTVWPMSRTLLTTPAQKLAYTEVIPKAMEQLGRPVRVIIADDHPVVRGGLHMAIRQDPSPP